MKHYDRRAKRFLVRAVMKMLTRDDLSPGFVNFLESRSFFLQVAIVVTTWLGPLAQVVWPFHMVVRFTQANYLLFEGADAPSLGSSQIDSGQSGRPGPCYDLVVVGSGPGGSVSALRHLEAGKRVLLIEEGPDVPTGKIAHHSVDQAQAQLRDLGLQIVFGTMPVAFAQGRTVGGGSEVNSGLYHRLPEPYRSHVLEATGFSDSEWTTMESKVERALGIRKAPASFRSKYRESAKDFIVGSTNLGLEVEEVARWRTYSPETHNGMKNTYLKQFLEKGGVLVSQSTVTRITENPSHVIVEFHSGSQIISVCSMEVVVAAGAIETARLLKNSGIVRKFSFPLGFHPMVRALAEHTESVNEDGHFPPFQAWDSNNQVKLGFSVSTFNYLRATYAAITGKVLDNGRLPKFLAYFASFTLQDSRAFTIIFAKRAYSWIRWGMADKRKMRRAEALLSDVLIEGGAKNVVSNRARPTLSTVHIFGSMPLGPSGLVDKSGRVLGTARVYVCDSSLMPVAPWVNPQGPIMVLCELVTMKKLSR